MRKYKFPIIGLVIAVLVALAITSCFPKEKGNIALIRLNGSIAEAPQLGFFFSAITPEQVKGYLERAERDGAIKAVVLRLNSPGGTVAASQEIAEMIKKFKKPIVISMGDTVASGGYYISAYADWIVAQPGTMTGSIGVITQLMNVSGLLDKLGLKPEIIKSGRHKDMFFGLRPLTEEERQILQDLCDDAYEDFINAVAEGRKLGVERVRELATGQVYTGEQAKKLGLVDELGGLKVALDKAAELAKVAKPKVVEYKPPAPWWERFLPGIFSKLGDKGIKISTEQLLYLQILQILEGWNAVPRYQ